MPPYTSLVDVSVRDMPTKSEESVKQKQEPKQYKWEIVWKNVAILAIIYSMGIYGGYVCLFKAKWTTFIFAYIYATITALGVTAGTHRLWSHRAYKANLPLRIYLMIAHSGIFRTSVFDWAREHRTHHKYSDTDADPHNASRGLFFSHIGCLVLKQHKDVIEKAKTIDVSDLMADPVLRFQNRFKFEMFLLFAFTLPTFVPCYFWNEDLWISYAVCSFRYFYTINLIMTINSFAHKYGTKPYDKTILSTDGQPFSSLMLGEGWHNYHHAFPWDYRAAEFGNNGLSTTLIYWMSKIGWATDLKMASDDLIRKRMLRTGDGTVTGVLKKKSGAKGCDDIWGWGDVDMDQKEKEDIEKINS